MESAYRKVVGNCDCVFHQFDTLLIYSENHTMELHDHTSENNLYSL